MEHLGPAAHKIIAGCHRQAEEFSALRRTYAETLKRRIALDVGNLRKAALVSNAYYCNLVAPAMSILISGNLDENDVDALVEETICGAQSAKQSKTDGAASKVAVSSGSAQPSSAQVVQTQAFSPSAWYRGPAPALPPWAGPPAGYGILAVEWASHSAANSPALPAGGGANIIRPRRGIRRTSGGNGPADSAAVGSGGWR